MPLPQSLKRLSKKLSKYVIILFLSVIFFITFLLLNNNFKINSFEITGIKKIKLNGLDSLIGQNIIFLNGKKTANILINENAELKNAVVEKIYPNKLKIDVKYAQPLALFKVNDGYLLLNDTGRITSKKRNLDIKLPIIKYYQQFDFTSFQIGDKLDYKDINISLEIIKIFLNLGMNPDSIDIKDISMITSNIGDKKILFTTEKDFNRQKSEVEAIIKQFKVQAKDYKMLDLRFDKPIVKF